MAHGKRNRLNAAAVAAALLLSGAAEESAHAAPKAAMLRSSTAAAFGEFRLLTYNVAGLPILVSSSNPVDNTPIIGGLLNHYDVAVVQEDFAYHVDLAARATHEYRTPPVVPNDKDGIGDGLNLFSRIPFKRLERIPWKSCHGKFTDGSDCFAPKGFTVTTQVLGHGAEVDLYNVHLDSGRSAGDRSARSKQIDQLIAYIAKRSPRRAIIVAGDTNIGADSEGLLERLLSKAGLADACRALSCEKPTLIDRVMYRSSSKLRLTVSDFQIDPRFVREDGKNLSDHVAVGVAFHWERR